MSNTRFQLDRSAWHSPYEERTYRAFPETDFIENPMRFLYHGGFELVDLARSLVLPSDYLPILWFDKPQTVKDGKATFFNTRPTAQPIEEGVASQQLYLFMSQHGAVLLSTDDNYLESMKDKFHPHWNPWHREFYVGGAPQGIDEVIKRTFEGVRIIEPGTPTLRRRSKS